MDNEPEAFKDKKEPLLWWLPIITKKQAGL
jgi:hypothetical protein